MDRLVGRRRHGVVPDYQTIAKGEYQEVEAELKRTINWEESVGIRRRKAIQSPTADHVLPSRVPIGHFAFTITLAFSCSFYVLN